jgi:hypothetical protein
MLYDNLKKIIKKIPFLWKFLVWLKIRLMILSRLKDVLMMMLLFHIWPEQTYRFSTRKFLPSKKNRFSKQSRSAIPYEHLMDKSSKISKMKEITIIGRGNFDLNTIKKIDGPIFLISFWNPLKIDNGGKIFYNHPYSYETGIEMELEKYLSTASVGKDYKNENITYVINRTKILKILKKREHDTLAVSTYYEDQNGKAKPFHEDLATSSFTELFGKRISVIEKIYKPPLIDPYPFFAPSGSLLPILCALSYFAEKINVYGWDFYLDSPPEKMNYWQLFFNMYKYKYDFRSKNHFESAIINFYYGYQLSKLSNINIHGYMGQLNNHEKLIRRIEKVLFQ